MFDRISEGRWWDLPLTLVESCTPCSPGCQHCWALAMEKRFRGELPVKFRRDALDKAIRRKKPTAYAVWNDLFHPSVSGLDTIYALEAMGALPQHVFMVLTKRPHRMANSVVFPDNVWAGTTVCINAEVEERLCELMNVIVGVRFVSYEPALERIVITNHLMTQLSWVIAGCESGHDARPAQDDWFREIRDKCVKHGVPFFLKQMMIDGKLVHAPELDGRQWLQLPNAVCEGSLPVADNIQRLPLSLPGESAVINAGSPGGLRGSYPHTVGSTPTPATT